MCRGESKTTFASAVRFAKVLRLDFFPQLVQPLTGALYVASPCPSYQHFLVMGSDPHWDDYRIDEWNTLLKAAVVENVYADALIKEDSYLFCLSRASDSLYQWRSYAPTGGVAIGFRRADLYNALFDAVVYDPEIEPNQSMFNLLKCRYDDKSVAKLIDRLTIQVKEEDVEKQKTGDFLSLFKCECTAFSLFVASLMKVVCTQKNPTFSEEKEERFLLSGHLCHRIEVLGGKPRIVFRSSDAVAISIGEIKMSPHGDVAHNKYWVADKITHDMLYYSP